MSNWVSLWLVNHVLVDRHLATFQPIKALCCSTSCSCNSDKHKHEPLFSIDTIKLSAELRDKQLCPEHSSSVLFLQQRSRDMSSRLCEEVKSRGDALNGIDRHYTGDLSQTVAKKTLLMYKLLPDVIAPLSFRGCRLHPPPLILNQF